MPGDDPVDTPRRQSPMLRMLPAVGLTWIAVGLFATALLHLAMGSPLDDATLDERGVKVMATPVSMRLGSSSNNGAVQRHVIRLRFEDPSGKTIETELENDHQDQEDAAEAGTPLEIEYDPQDPSIVRWAGSRINPLGMFVYWIGGAIVVLGLGTAAFGLFLRTSKRRA